MAFFSRILLLHATVEEESDVRVFLGFCGNMKILQASAIMRVAMMHLGNPKHTGDVALLDVVFGEPFGQDVGHSLGRESNAEGEIGLVLRHGCNILSVEWRFV